MKAKRALTAALLVLSLLASAAGVSAGSSDEVYTPVDYQLYPPPENAYVGDTMPFVTEDGTLERGTYKALNGRLVLDCGGRLVIVGENGTFTYRSQKNPEKKYDFRLDAGDLEKLISAVK